MESKCPLDPIIEKLVRAYTTESVGTIMQPFDSSKSGKDLGANQVFDSCRNEVINMIKSGQITSSSLRPCLKIWEQFGRYINIAERVAYFLYLISKEFANDLELQKNATGEYLKLLLTLSNNLLEKANRTKDPTTLVNARGTANQALKIIESVSGYSIDPYLHSELLLAMGSTYAVRNIRDNFRPAIFIDYYSKALDLKKGDPYDFNRLKDMIKNAIVREILPKGVFAGPFGIGRAVQELEAAYNASKKLNDPNLVFNVGTTLADLYSKVTQSGRAEAILKEILSLQILSKYRKDLINAQLASALSEQSRPKEAADIQEALIRENSPILSDANYAASIWNNLGNSYRELGKLNDACDAFERALQFDSQMEPNDENRKAKEFQTLTLLGECLFMLGNSDKAEEKWKKAESLKVLDYSGIDRINFHSKLARCYFEAKIFDKALIHLNDTRENLYHQMEQGDLNPNVWESMLSTWSYIDGRSIEILLTYNPGKQSYEEALVIAEAAKGRLLSKIMSEFPVNKTSSYKLSLDYYKQILDKVIGYIKEHPEHKILSLFAEKDGTAVFSISEDGLVTGKWIKIDQQFLNNYGAWNSIIPLIDTKTYGKASKLTEILLDKIGEWLLNSNLELAKGGKDLVIIPHGPLRNIPLSHCKLPAGKRLSECFSMVTTLPSLYDLSSSLERSENYLIHTNMSALVDPDGSLPFARLDGLFVVGIGAAKIGSEVTANAIRESLSKHGVVLLSSHGIFNKENAWTSSIKAADGGRIELSKLLLEHSKIAADLVVLGVCEVGRSRISYSDEPIGFPGIMIKAGVPAVVAPMWMVDDFSSHLFLTTFLQFISEGIHPASALQKTSVWLREVKASDVLDKIALIENKIDNINNSVNISNTIEYVKSYLNEIKQSLQNKPSNLRPFESPLHWAAFQVTGFTPYTTQ